MTGRDYFYRILGQPGAPQEQARMIAGLTALEGVEGGRYGRRRDRRAGTAPGRRARSTFLPADADLDKPETWIALRDVLRWLGDCPAHRKLLLLETTLPQADALRGALADDAAAGSPTRSRISRDDDPHLLVLCASAPGQVACNDEELGRSVMSFYLEEGLRGWADHDESTGNRDGLVSARELGAFVAARVDRWAGLDRGSAPGPGPERQGRLSTSPWSPCRTAGRGPTCGSPGRGAIRNGCKIAWKRRDAHAG